MHYRSGVLRPMWELVSISALAGIICVSHLIWFLLWVMLYCILGGRESVGTLPVWTAIFLGAILLGGLIAEADL